MTVLLWLREGDVDESVAPGDLSEAEMIMLGTTELDDEVGAIGVFSSSPTFTASTSAARTAVS